MSVISPFPPRAESGAAAIARGRLGWLALAMGLALGLWAGRGMAAELRVVTWNVQNGVGAPGSTAYAAVRETLERLAPDVIALQEVDAQNPAPSSAIHFSDLRALLLDLGFPTTRTHLATTGDGFRAQPFSAGDFGNSSQSIAIASRHPITRALQIGRGATGRRELTRYPLLVTIDVPSTEGLTLVAVHMKQGDTQADEFRRGVEALRVREVLAAEGLSGTTHHVLVVGDMNEEINEPQTSSFPTAGVNGGHIFGDGSALPATWRSGPGVPDPMAYAGFPASAFAAVGLSMIAATQTDGTTDRTYTYAGDARLDYLLTGSATRSAGAVRAEVYHSGREPVGDGLPKRAQLPSTSLSLDASDHLPVMADLVLDGKPALTLTLPVAAQTYGFEPAAVPLPGTVAIDQPLEAPLTVNIAPFRAAPVLPISAVVIPAGETSAAFPLALAGSPFAPDRRITLMAVAEGHRSGIGTLSTRGTGVAGPLLISQYTETPSGSSPKAIEVMNVTGREINFAAEPLEIISYAGGSTDSTPEVRAEYGRMHPGAVVVIGDAATGQHMVAEGRFAATGTAVATAPTGTIFTDSGEPDGCAIYIKRGFRFNGDDALEVRLNSRRCDVFGFIGHDPGTAWTGGGISTANQNLSRRRAAIAPSAGWTNPRLAFETAGVTLATALDGFGESPVLDDPYVEWAAARGLAGPSAAIDADPDGNGVANGLEFAFGDGANVVPALLTPVPGQRQMQLTLRVRHRLGTVRWGVATAESLQVWQTRWEETSPWVTPPAEFRPLTVTLPASANDNGQARLFLIQP